MKTVLFLSIMMSFFMISVLCLWFITIHDFSEQGTQVKQDIHINQIAVNNFNSLKPPIILLAKDKTMGLWGVVLIDSTKKIVTIGDLTALGNRLGVSYNVGDTIVK